MGWDAYAAVKKDIVNNKLEDPIIDKLFENAETYVKSKCECVDGYLRIGALDCSDCAEMLEKATGQSVYDEDGWSQNFVKKLEKEADWDFEYPQCKSWAYWSAKKFLQTCAKANLAIRFSW